METKKEKKTFEQIKKEMEGQHKRAVATMSKRFPNLYPVSTPVNKS